MKKFRFLFLLALFMATSLTRASVNLGSESITAETQNIELGEDGELIVYLHGDSITEPIVGWSMTLQLPAGVGVAEEWFHVFSDAMYGDGTQAADCVLSNVEITVYSRLPGQGYNENVYTFSWSPDMADCDCYSSLLSNNGELARIPLTVSNSFNSSISGIIKDISLWTQNETYTCPNFNVRFARAQGDVNGDQVVDVADVTAIVNVMGANGDVDFGLYADVNQDGVLDVADIGNVYDIMAGIESPDGNPNGKNVLSANPITIAKGGTANLDIYIDYESSKDVRDWNFSLYLPEGITVSNATISEAFYGDAKDDYYLKRKRKSDGGYLLTCVNYDLMSMPNTHGTIVTLTLKATADVSGTGYIKGIALSSSDCESLDLGNIADAQFDINKPQLTITANNATKTYGAANPALTVSYSGFINGDDETVLATPPTVTTTATQNSPVGTYPITVSGAVSGKYEIIYVPGTLTVTKASQSMALSSIPAQTYGGAAYTLPATTAQGQTLTWTVANTDIATVSGNTLTVKKAGSTKVTATQAGAANYNAFSKEFTLTVNKAALTITADDKTKIYGAANPTLSVSYSGFVNGDDSSVLTTQPTVTTTAQQTSQVGTYPITVSGAEAANYDITYVAGTLTVTKASQSMPLTDIPEQTYGAEAYPLPTTTAQGQTLTWTVANTDIATVIGNTLTVKNAGSTKVTATQTGGTNYDAFSKEFTLTVNKAALTITADNKTKNVGEENPALTVTYSGFKNGDNASSLTTQPTVTTTATKESPVGTYPITVGGASAVNYDITYVGGTLTVVDGYTQNNTLGGLDTEGLVGHQTTLEIVLTNADVVRLCQFDLRLPAGVTVALNNKNKLDATLTDRASTHSISSKQLANGAYRFVLSSLDGDAFTGNEGTLVNIVLDIADDAETGEQTVSVFNIELSVPVGNDLKVVKPIDAVSILTISIPSEEVTYKDGDTFTDKTIEDVEMIFKVISATEKTCQVGVGGYSQWDEGHINLAVDKAVRGKITIPSTVKGFKVVGIGGTAFWNCDEITEVVVPEGVAYIGVQVFYHNSKLAAVTLPTEMESIGYEAFDGCESLTEIVIPEGVKELCATFNRCTNLSKVQLPSTLTRLIGGGSEWLLTHGVFQYCEKLSSVVLPSSLTFIGENSFANCERLQSINIPDGVTIIEGGAFSGCLGIKNVDLPPRLSKIGGYALFSGGAFSGTSITSIVIPETVTEIGAGAFSFCEELTSIEVDPRNTVYDSRGGCNAIIATGQNTLIAGCKNTVIPSTITKIAAQSFFGVSGLRHVTIPKNVLSVSGHPFDISSDDSVLVIPAFIYCRDLESITVEEGNPVFDSREGCNAIIETATNTLVIGTGSSTIPESVTRLGSYSVCNGKDHFTIPKHIKYIDSEVFGNYWFFPSPVTGIAFEEGYEEIPSKALYGSGGLTKLTLPSTITTIGDSAFVGCYGLKTVICYMKRPITLDKTVFDSETLSSQDVTLYVPKGTKELYEQREISGSINVWSQFKNIVEIVTGDVNLDGAVDVADIATVISVMAGGDVQTSEADVNCDGNVDVADIAVIVDIMAGATLSMTKATR